jgi:hypothetical protein
LSLVIIIILFRDIICELKGLTSNTNNKKRININSLFIIINSVENNLGFSSLNSFLNILKIILWFRFILYNYIYYKRNLVFQGFSFNYNISKIIVFEPEDKSFNNIIKFIFPSIIRFINFIFVIENIEDIISQKIILLK